jgi:hypothetical protein
MLYPLLLWMTTVPFVTVWFNSHCHEVFYRICLRFPSTITLVPKSRTMVPYIEPIRSDEKDTSMRNKNRARVVFDRMYFWFAALEEWISQSSVPVKFLIEAWPVLLFNIRIRIYDSFCSSTTFNDVICFPVVDCVLLKSMNKSGVF